VPRPLHHLAKGNYMTLQMNRVVVLLALLSLVGCGSTSNMKRSDGTTDIRKAADFDVDFSSYNRVIVQDFAVGTGREHDDRAKQAVYEANVAEGGKRFADKIATAIKGGAAFTEVLRNEDAKQGDLLIKGEVTKFKQGNRVARWITGIGGKANFNAIVRFVDAGSGKELSLIDVNKNSWLFGGVGAALQDVNDFIDGAAKKVAEQTLMAKLGTNSVKN
jgi:Domain of unknown function (DUF4410)